MKCGICDIDQSNPTFKVKEMMFGTQEEFSYFECLSCGCLQLSGIPGDMSKYYPQDYYISSKQRSKGIILRIKLLLMRIRKIVIARRANFLSFYLNDYMRNDHINFDSKILEVGCGTGELVRNLYNCGFNNILGIDPYIDDEFIRNNKFIAKSTIYELHDSQKFDLIIFNHVFEHVPDQLETLTKVSNILSDSGVCLIRIPIKTEYIWNRYGVNWVQIDAPRHLFLHTLNSFESLVKKSGLTIKNIIFDSNEFQFWGSEQYNRKISLRASNSYSINPKKSIFSNKQIKKFKIEAGELNKDKQGDQAAFIICKAAKK